MKNNVVALVAFWSEAFHAKGGTIVVERDWMLHLILLAEQALGSDSELASSLRMLAFSNEFEDVTTDHPVNRLMSDWLRQNRNLMPNELQHCVDNILRLYGC